MKYVCNFTHLTPRTGGRFKNLGGTVQHTFEISQKKGWPILCFPKILGGKMPTRPTRLEKLPTHFQLALLSGCEKILALHVAKWSHKIRHFDTLTLLTGNFR